MKFAFPLLLASGFGLLAAREPFLLEETVVSPTRSARDILATPHALDVVSDEDLRLVRMVRSLPESLHESPGVLVQKTAHGQGSPFIRGFTGFRNLLRIDGVRLNHAAFREGPNQYWNTVDALSIRRYELVRGPGSVLYGSDAVGGTLSVETFDPEEPVRPALLYRGSSAERSHTGRVEGGHAWENGLRLEGGFTAREFGDLEGGRDVGTQENTGYDERAWDARLAWAVDDGLVLLSHNGIDQDEVPRTHKTVHGISWRGTEVGRERRRDLDQARRLTTLQLRKETWQAGLSLHRHEEDRDRVRGDGRRDRQGFDLDSWGAFLQAEPAEGWVAGVELYVDDVDSYRDDFDPDGSFRGSAVQGPVADDARYLTVGAYAQRSLRLRDDLDLLLGGRAEYAEAEADRFEDPETGAVRSLDRDFDTVVGSARLLWRIDEGLSAWSGLSQGFRAPNLSDLTRLDSARSNEIETPSPDVDPEHFLSAELGLKLRRERWSGTVSGYVTDIDDLIVRTPTGRMIEDEFEVTKENAAEGLLYGVEAEAEVELAPGWLARGFAAWQRGRADAFPGPDREAVREPMSRILPATGFLALRRASDRWWLEGTLNAAAKADRLSSRDRRDTQRIPPGGTPSWAVFGLRAGWEATDQLSLSLACENLADEDYRVHGSGLNQPGRNVVFGARYTF